jgi:hypothetical protein
MGTGNATPAPSRDLATTITTTTVNNHAAGDAVVGAVSIVNDRDDVGGGRGPSGFDKEEALVLTAESVAVLIADDADGGDGSVAIVGGTFEEAITRAGTAGVSGVGTTTMGGGGGGGSGNYADPAGAILVDDGRHLLGPSWRRGEGTNYLELIALRSQLIGIAMEVYTWNCNSSELQPKKLQSLRILACLVKKPLSPRSY